MKKFSLRYAFDPRHREHIHAIAADFVQFGEFHPLIKKVTLAERISPQLAHFDVREETKLFGWLKMRPRYRVRVATANDHDGVVYSAKIMGLMRLKITLSFEQEGPNMWLVEDVEVSDLPGLTKMFMDVFQPAHDATFENIRRKLDGEMEQLVVQK